MMTPLTRFELAVVVRVQVSDLAILRHYLAVEAAMEELARELNVDVAMAAMTGFGAAIDAQLCAANPPRRGEVAAEMLRTENAATEVIDAVRDARRADADALSPLAAALWVADTLVGAALAIIDDEDNEGDILTELAPRTVVMTATRAKASSNPDTERAERAAKVIALPLERAAELVLTGMRRVRVALEL